MASQTEPNFVQTGQNLGPVTRTPLPPPGGAKKGGLLKRGIFTTPEAAIEANLPRGVGQGSASQGVAKGSGLSKEDSASDKNASTSRFVQDQYMPAEQYEDLYNTTASLPTFKDQLEGVNNLQELASYQAAMPTQMDLSPLMQLAENASGKKIAYTKPKTAEDRQAVLLAYAAKLQDDRRDVSKSITDAMAKRKYGSFLDTQQTEQLARMVDQAADPMKYAKIARAGSAGKGYDAAKDVEKLQKKLAPYDDMLSSVEQFESAVAAALGVPSLDDWNGKKDIPGLGATGSSLIPNFALSRGGKDIALAKDMLYKDMALATGGKALTAVEKSMVQRSLGQMASGDDRTAMQGLVNLKSGLRKIFQQREAAFKGVHPEVTNLYKEGGGRLSGDVSVPKGNWGGKGSAGGGTKLDQLKQQNAEIEKLLKAQEGAK
jgi:hypothetical protein